MSHRRLDDVGRNRVELLVTTSKVLPESRGSSIAMTSRMSDRAVSRVIPGANNVEVIGDDAEDHLEILVDKH